MDEFKKVPRKKIWEINSSFHCSLAGTCLSLEETKKIFRKSGITLPPGVRDYEIHGATVNFLSVKNDVAKSIHNFIEKKYTYFINMFGNASSEEELMHLWDDFLEKGNIAGAYWALMTHPSVTQRNLDRAFGDVHMMSHINGSSSRASIREVGELKRANTHLLKTKDGLNAKITELKDRIKLLENQNSVISELRDSLIKAESEIVMLRNGSESNALKTENTRINTVLNNAMEKTKRLTDAASAAETRVAELLTENFFLRDEITAKDEELQTMENSLLSLLQRGKGTCNGCMVDEQNRIDLCGKCILYVGGKPSVVSRCREMVEHYGGKFIHHDGGKEENLSRLPAVMSRADAIFCPLDCVSHNACLSVKKMSQHHRKPFMLLKSSGLSSFLKGVSEISRGELITTEGDSVQNQIYGGN